MKERGRGADHDPVNRFNRYHVEPDAMDPADGGDAPRPLQTVFFRDDSQSILTPVEADDLSFDYGINPYRGCEHGCAYCYARTFHEYLGFSAGLDFESKIVVKHDAAVLLEKALANPSYRVGKIALSGATDCYQPVERKLGITRACLEVLARFRNPVAVITKNSLIARDVDHLAELAAHGAVAVYLSITTLDAGLARILEPRASSPRSRLETLRTLAAAGVPVGVSAAPMIPGLNDSELPAILAAAAEHGAGFAAYSMVRLPGSVAEVFASWLDRHMPGAKDKILNRIRASHGGQLNSSIAGERMRGTGAAAAQWRALFHASCRRHGLATAPPELNATHFRRLSPGQGELF
jgi:DNA repair photolyase